MKKMDLVKISSTYGLPCQSVSQADHGDILITSRHAALDRLGKTMKLSALSSEAAVSLNTVNFQHRDVATQIVNRLGMLVLAVDQAAAYIRYQQVSLDDLESFLVKHENQRKTILKYVPEDFWEYTTQQSDGELHRSQAISAFTTREMSLKQLLTTPGFEQSAVEGFISVTAFLSSVQIEGFLSRSSFEFSKECEGDDWMNNMFCSENDSDENDVQVNNYGEASTNYGPRFCYSHKKYWVLISRLQVLSLVERMHNDDDELGVIFQFHPLIRDWIQMRGGRRKRVEYVEECVQLVAVCAGVAYKTWMLRQAQHLVKHMNACMDSYLWYCMSNVPSSTFPSQRQWQCWLLFAEVYSSQGLSQEAESCSCLELIASVDAFGSEDPNTIAATNRLISKLIAQSKFDEAERLMQVNLAISRKILGDGHPIMRETMIGLTGICRQNKRFDEAESILRKILTLENSTHSSDPSSSFFLEACLCQIHCEKGDYSDAEILARSTLDAMSVYSDGCSNTQLWRQSIAFSLTQSMFVQNRHQEAEDLLRQEITRAQRTLGGIDRGTRLLINTLGWCLFQQGKSEAVEVFKTLAECERQVFYDGHPNSLNSAKSLNTAPEKFGMSEQQLHEENDGDRDKSFREAAEE